jgi:peptidoglycan/LPS O-acetylase OafA/YrhL
MSLALWTSKLAQASGLSRGYAISLAFILYLPAVLLLASIFYRLVDAPSMRLAALISKRPIFWRKDIPAKSG